MILVGSAETTVYARALLTAELGLVAATANLMRDQLGDPEARWA